MHRTPPYEDERPEDPQVFHSSQQRNNTNASRRRQMYYYSDEHPEIPKIRRASLHLDQEPDPPPSTSARARADRPTASPSPASRSARHARPSSSPSSRPARPEKAHASSAARSARSKRLREDDETETRPVSPSGSTSSHKTTVARLRRPDAHEPPPLARPPARRQPRSFQVWLQDTSHNRTALLIGTAVLVALIILPILVSTALNGLNRTTTTTLPGSSRQGIGNGPAASGSPPADPHELVITPTDTDHPAPPVFATSAYLMDADTGATLYAYNPFMHLPMLSTTKLMTATLAAEQGNPDQKITINDAIAHDINQLSADSALMGIKKGETYTLRDLLYGLLLPSGNDAAIAIADGLAGNLTHFVAEMNQKAKQLGMYDTHYMNPHGLLMTGHYSSAHDLAVIGRYSLSIPLIHQISGTKQYTIPQTAEHAEHILVNGNQFLWWYPGVDAGKTGWDNGSDFIQVISCVRNNHHLIGVTMHTVDWWTDMRDLMNWGFDTFSWVSPYNADITHPPIPFDYEWNYFVKDKKENTIPTADKGRYYIYTGYSISGPILDYFNKNGGLQKLGYPIGLPRVTTDTIVSQQFEHATLQCNMSTRQCTQA